jgi:hypothetical protein
VAEQDKCVRCGAFLTKDETALTRKLINRGATEFFCLSCLAGHFQLSEEILRKKIEEFKAMGCTLFNP